MAQNCLSASWRSCLGASILSGCGQTRRVSSSLVHLAASPQLLLPSEASSDFCALIPRNCMPWGSHVASLRLSFLYCNVRILIVNLSKLCCADRRTKIRNQYSAVSGPTQWSGDEDSALPHAMQHSQRQRSRSEQKPCRAEDSTWHAPAVSRAEDDEGDEGGRGTFSAVSGTR